MLIYSIRCGCLGLAAAAMLLLGACSGGGGATVDPSVANGRISGELTIVGPVNRNVDIVIGVAPDGQDDCLQSSMAGRFTSEAESAIDGRRLSFDFDGLPLGAYNLLVFSQQEDGTKRIIHYRSGKLKLTAENAQLTNFSEDVSLTGPPPWGTISGLLLLNGANDTLPQLQLAVYTEQKGALGYTFSVWDAGFGALFFTVGGLSTGDYRLGISDPVSHQLLGYDERNISLTARAPDAAGVILHGDFYSVPPEGEGYFISGTAVFNGELPAGRHIAVLALNEDDPLPTHSPTFHVQPEYLDESLETEYFLGWLREGDYKLAIYALDFVGGEHRLISQLGKPIAVDGKHPLNTGVIVRGDVALIP